MTTGPLVLFLLPCYRSKSQMCINGANLIISKGVNDLLLAHTIS